MKRKSILSVGLAVLVATSLIGLEVGAPAAGWIGFVKPAEARVGRPLTPVSVAGVGRRTVRRCAVGVYYC